MNIFEPKNETEVSDIIRTHPLVVVDLYSTDCPPCNRLAPIYERMAQQYPSVIFVKIHRQAFRDLAESYHIFSSPTILFFHRNHLQDRRLAGIIQENELQSEIERLIQQEHTATSHLETQE